MEAYLATRCGKPVTRFSSMSSLIYGPLMRGQVILDDRRQPQHVTASAAVKLGIFSLASVIVTGVLVVIMGHIGLGDQTTYKAVFSNASQLLKGDDVRVAGVSVGEVKKVEVLDRTEALVTFKVKSDVPLTTASRAEIRFLNLVGDRYLGLEQGTPRGAEAEGGRHPPGLADQLRRSTSRCCSTGSSRCSRRSTPRRSTSSR